MFFLDSPCFSAFFYVSPCFPMFFLRFVFSRVTSMFYYDSPCFSVFFYVFPSFPVFSYVFPCFPMFFFFSPLILPVFFFFFHMLKKQSTLGDVNDTVLRGVYFNLRFCLKESFAVLLIDARMRFSKF